jgi:hypothetical protein
MVDQTMVTSERISSFPERDHPEPSVNSVVSNVAGFGENVLNLTELQFRLAVVELKRNFDTAKSGGLLVVVGVLVVLGALPVAFAGIAELLVSELALSRGLALLIVSGIAGMIAACCLVIATIKLRRQHLGFRLSSEELSRNVMWLRAILRHSGRIPGRRAQDQISRKPPSL